MEQLTVVGEELIEILKAGGGESLDVEEVRTAGKGPPEDH